MNAHISFHSDKSLERLPKTVQAGNVESIDITGCWGLTQLELGDFTSLRKLIASDCRALVSIALPQNGMLKELRADACRALLEIVNLEKQTALETLFLDDCWSLLAVNVREMQLLKFLDLRNCRSLTTLIAASDHELVYSDLRGVLVANSSSLIKANVTRC